MSFGFTLQFIAAAIEKKQANGNRLVVFPQAANALNPLLFATVVRESRQRVVHQSHALPAGCKRSRVLCRDIRG
jgi:hypothetical protein